jgi:hypothetical protein
MSSAAELIIRSPESLGCQFLPGEFPEGAARNVIGNSRRDLQERSQPHLASWLEEPDRLNIGSYVHCQTVTTKRIDHWAVDPKSLLRRTP